MVRSILFAAALLSTAATPVFAQSFEATLLAKSSNMGACSNFDFEMVGKWSANIEGDIATISRNRSSLKAKKVKEGIYEYTFSVTRFGSGSTVTVTATLSDKSIVAQSKSLGCTWSSKN